MGFHFSEDQLYTIPSIALGIIVLLLFFNLIRKRNKVGKNKDLPPVKEENKTLTELRPVVSVPLVPITDTSRPWILRLRTGLSKTRGQIVKNLDEFFISKQDKVTREETLERLFELLIEADVGVTTSEILVERVKSRLQTEDYSNPENFKTILKEEILLILKSSLENKHGTLESPKHTPHMVLMVGVNGAGKTTTTGKLAYKSYQREKKVIIGAADTFRAAAVEQLAIWAERSHAHMLRLKEGSDPASVAYEAAKKSIEQNADICLIDTAGRLQTRSDLMQELSKIARVIGKDVPEAPHEVLLVLDATIGQNALQQAKLFREVVKVTGVILTKLDGTAKGGIAVAIAFELGLPIRYVGVGETVEDLALFDAHEFVDALFC